jgi:ectoine hydroxylase-related dioxygenase (phytanoyl-CoA dioxygenase family)
VPGSHHWPLLPRASFANEMEAILDHLTPSQRAAFHPIPIELKAGECSFHHPFMVHGSYANETDTPRRALVLNAFLDGTLSVSDAPLLEGVAVIRSGQKIDGQFFPLLSDA